MTGDYSALLGPGWHLERIDGSTATPVVATLISENPVAFTVMAHQRTDVPVRFRVDTEVVDMTQGYDIVLTIEETGSGAAISPVAPSAAHPMYQGGQQLFKTHSGATCTGRVAASMSNGGFCYLAANDDVRCAGVVGETDYGMAFQSTGQRSATQIMLMFGIDNGMCVSKTDHTVQCMGSNTNAFGASGISPTFTQWTDHSDVAAIATGTWDQICGITLAGQVFCSGIDVGYPAHDIGEPGQTSLWVDTSGAVRPSDPEVLRPGQSRTECQVKAHGLFCEGEALGPTDGTVVMGTNVSGGFRFDNACWLTEDATVTCTFGPRFAPGRVLYLAADLYTDSMCAIYKDGSVWCMGSNANGKLGTGDDTSLDVETMVAPPGSARAACDL